MFNEEGLAIISFERSWLFLGSWLYNLFLSVSIFNGRANVMAKKFARSQEVQLGVVDKSRHFFIEANQNLDLK